MTGWRGASRDDERLCRYGLRPPLAQGRLSETKDGALLYTMKRRFSDGHDEAPLDRRPRREIDRSYFLQALVHRL